MRLRPNAAEPASRLAWFLATCPDAKVRDAARAVELAERACDVTKHRDPQMLDTLAAAYAEAGRFDDAVATATTALHLARSQRREQLAADIQHRIEQYAAARPFHEHRTIVRGGVRTSDLGGPPPMPSAHNASPAGSLTNPNGSRSH